MTDIVERLRSPEFADVAEKYLMVEAATEIERLEAEIKELRDDLSTFYDNVREITRLHAHINKQDREIERLRAALQGVVDDVLDYEHINNLAPNPGRKYCWDSIERAIAAQQPTEHANWRADNDHYDGTADGDKDWES